MPEVSMKNMLEAGVHFGHQTHRWNPKMKQYIYGPRNGIYIIDLEKTVRHAREACEFVKNTVADGGKVLFVATKKQAKGIAREASERAGMPFVTDRWLGGTLTNFQTIRRGCEKLDQLDTWKQDGTYSLLPKKETVVLDRKRKKLDASLGGVRAMRSLPAALFIIDPETERIAVREANRLGIPVVAVVDTNCNPDLIDFVIPGNDDAIKSVTLFVNLIADACVEGGTVFEQRMRHHGAPAPVATAAATADVVTTVGEPSYTAAKSAAGPVVERVVKKQVRNIPTDIDYRAQDVIEEEPQVPGAGATAIAEEVEPVVEVVAPVAEVEVKADLSAVAAAARGEAKSEKKGGDKKKSPKKA